MMTAPIMTMVTAGSLEIGAIGTGALIGHQFDAKAVAPTRANLNLKLPISTQYKNQYLQLEVSAISTPPTALAPMIL